MVWTVGKEKCEIARKIAADQGLLASDAEDLK
jgi:hypothetical protein